MASELPSLGSPGNTWYADSDEVFAFATALHAAGYFDSTLYGCRQAVDNVLRYFEKPWHHDLDYRAWDAHGRPSDETCEGWSDFTGEL